MYTLTDRLRALEATHCVFPTSWRDSNGHRGALVYRGCQGDSKGYSGSLALHSHGCRVERKLVCRPKTALTTVGVPGLRLNRFRYQRATIVIARQYNTDLITRRGLTVKQSGGWVVQRKRQHCLPVPIPSLNNGNATLTLPALGLVDYSIPLATVGAITDGSTVILLDHVLEKKFERCGDVRVIPCRCYEPLPNHSVRFCITALPQDAVDGLK